MEFVCKYIYHVFHPSHIVVHRSVGKYDESCPLWNVEVPAESHTISPLRKSFVWQRAPNIHMNTQIHTLTRSDNPFYLLWMILHSCNGGKFTHTKCAPNTFNVIAHIYVNDVIAKVNIPWKSETYFADVIAADVNRCAVLCSVPSDPIWSHCVLCCRIRNDISLSLYLQQQQSTFGACCSNSPNI